MNEYQRNRAERKLDTINAEIRELENKRPFTPLTQKHLNEARERANVARLSIHQMRKGQR